MEFWNGLDKSWHSAFLITKSCKLATSKNSPFPVDVLGTSTQKGENLLGKEKSAKWYFDLQVGVAH